MGQLPIEQGQEIIELKVSELSLLIKKTIDDNFGFVRVRGEVSGLKIASSGHAYFNLKDSDAILACTCWRPVMSRVNFKLQDGMEVIVSGRLSAYPAQSRYQLNAERIEESGSGALMELLMKRKAMLEKEGLFDIARKKPIPAFPKRIGVITSLTGAVIMDILHRVKDRCPVNVIIWPVAVQGESCAFEVSSAINGFNRMDEDKRPEVIIVARGGGSIEDLWGFNEEIVVRSAANSAIPIISAIGHETDFTLIDFASSLRAPTPTAAAELALPVLIDLRNKLDDIFLRYKITYDNIIKSQNSRLMLACALLASPLKILYPKQQQVDELSFRLAASLPNHLNLKLSSLNSIKLPINALYSLISRKKMEIENFFQKSSFLINKKLGDLESRIELNIKLLESMNIKQILKRGFAIIREENNIISSKAQIDPSREITIEWFDGKVAASFKEFKN